jgi:hypothetical protein
MYVRIKTKKTLFSKGDVATFSRYIYEIIKKKGLKNNLKNLTTGKEIKRTYTDEELDQTFDRAEPFKPESKKPKEEIQLIPMRVKPEEMIAQRREQRIIKKPVWESM